MDVIARLAGTMPILGVCLGHQAIGAVFGGDVVRAPRVDARQDLARSSTTARGVFAASRDRSSRRAITRSSSRRQSLPRGARGHGADRGRTRSWALRHQTLPVDGVQFHPESILTAEGKHLLANFLETG